MHANAFGFSIAEQHLDKFIELTNEKYKDVPQDPIYWVDFAWSPNEVDTSVILDIANFDDMWGQEIPRPYIAIKDISLSAANVQLLSRDKNPTLKISLPCGVDIMKFKSSEEEYEQFMAPNTILTLVGTCNKNEWNGRVTPQIIIEDFELRTEWVF